jgi:hypothetical protein
MGSSSACPPYPSQLRITFGVRLAVKCALLVRIKLDMVCGTQRSCFGDSTYMSGVHLLGQDGQQLGGGWQHCWQELC